MKVLGHRLLEGANLYADRPLWRLVVRSRTDPALVRARLQAVRLDLQGDDLGQMLGSLIIRLQARAGQSGEVHACWHDADGDWFVLYGFDDPAIGEAAGRAAVGLVADAAAGRTPDVETAIDHMRNYAAEVGPHPSTRALLEVAHARGIPAMVRDHQHTQLGWGCHQRHLWGSITSQTSGLGYEIANDHERFAALLADTGIPVPRSDSRKTFDGCVELAAALRYPLTVKPLRGRGGVTVRVDDDAALDAAYDRAKEHHRWVVLQDHVAGEAFRVLVVDGTTIGAVHRRHGGDDVDVTDALHPAVRLASERAARIVGLDIVGVDVVAPSVSAPLAETGGKIVSLHPQPDLGPFLARGAAEAIISGLFPDQQDGRIPLVAVTGTNGKTTTVRLFSHILKYAGARVGMACTGAVEIQNQVILRGDYSGPGASRTVLREPTITHAVCEVARGGILKRGLGFDQCDAAALLNVASDHLGEGGIESIEDLVRLKSVVLRALGPSGTAVLNADDPRVWEQRHQVSGPVIPFSLDPDNPHLAAHLAADARNVVVTVNHGAVVLRRDAAEFKVADVMEIPITLEGAATFNVQNAMAATALAYAIGIREEDCRAGLLTFNPTVNQLPGRMNILRLGGVKVLLDYGHNVPALQALGEVIPRLAAGSKINVANGAGNRRDEDLRAFGGTLATMYDRIYLSDPDPRGRPPGETPKHVVAGVLATGFPPDHVVVELDEQRAFRRALAESRPGDLVVLQADDVENAIALCRELQQKLDAGATPASINEALLHEEQ